MDRTKRVGRTVLAVLLITAATDVLTQIRTRVDLVVVPVSVKD